MKQRFIFSFVAVCLFSMLHFHTAFAESATIYDDSHSCQQSCDNEKQRRGDHPRFDKEKFEREMQAYIISKAGLQPREAEAFFPLFFEMKEKMRNQQRKIDEAYRRADRCNMNSKDCERVLNETEKMEQKLNRIRADYMKRLRKVISPVKLVKAIAADQNFGRDQFRKMYHSAKESRERR